MVDLISNKNALNTDRPSYINFSTSELNATSVSRFSGPNNGSSTNMSTARSSRVTSVNTVRSDRKKSARQNLIKSNANFADNSQIKTFPQRPLTTHSKKVSMEDVKTPFRSTLTRYTASASVNRIKDELINPNHRRKDDPNFSKNFELTYNVC